MSLIVQARMNRLKALKATGPAKRLRHVRHKAVFFTRRYDGFEQLLT